MPLSFFDKVENERWESLRGWLLPSAAEELYRHCSTAKPDGAFVEIGSFAGKSSVCLARAIKSKQLPNVKLTAIDIGFQPEYHANLALFQAATLVNTIELPSLEAAESWSQPVSFLYIDGHHGKAHALADLLIWDMMLMPGAHLALDDTSGYHLGPNLQLQVIDQTSAYERLSDVGGISFFRKRHSILKGISDHPIGPGSLIAYVDYLGALTGAMDLEFRLPPKTRQSQNSSLQSALVTFMNRLWRTSPQQVFRAIKRKALPMKTSQRRNEAFSLLETLERVPGFDQNFASTLDYLRLCCEIQWSLDSAPEILSRLGALSSLEGGVEFLHYRLSVRELSRLRLGQVHDLENRREAALSEYKRLQQEALTPEIREYVERLMTVPFERGNRGQNRLLLREYNTGLLKYRNSGSVKIG